MTADAAIGDDGNHRRNSIADVPSASAVTTDQFEVVQLRRQVGVSFFDFAVFDLQRPLA